MSINNYDPNLKNRKLNLLERREICEKKIGKSNLTISNISRQFNVSVAVAKYLKAYVNAYLSLDPDDRTLEKRNNLSLKECKYNDIYDFMSNKVAILRSQGHCINYKILESLAEKYKNEHGMESFNVSKYFLRSFVKRSGLSYVTLSGESLSADISNIDEFKKKYKN